MPTKCCWVIHSSLTSERKASTSPSSFINHSTRPCCSIERSSAKLLVFTMSCTSKFECSTGSDVGSTRRRGNHMHDHSRFQRDINDVTGVSLSLPLTKVTDAQYRKRFRASCNILVFLLSFVLLQSLVRQSYKVQQGDLLVATAPFDVLKNLLVFRQKGRKSSPLAKGLR